MRKYPDDDYCYDPGKETPPWVAPAVVAAVLAFMVGCFVQLSRMAQ